LPVWGEKKNWLVLLLFWDNETGSVKGEKGEEGKCVPSPNKENGPEKKIDQKGREQREIWLKKRSGKGRARIRIKKAFWLPTGDASG